MSSSTGVGRRLDAVGVVGRVAQEREGDPGLAGQHRLGPGGLADRGDAAGGQHPDLGLRVEARAVDVAVAATVAHGRGPRRARRPAAAPRSAAENGRSKIQCPRPGRPGSVCSVQIEPSGSRLTRKCRSSKTISVPSGDARVDRAADRDGEDRVAPRARAAPLMLAWWVTWWESSRWPSQVAGDVQDVDAARTALGHRRRAERGVDLDGPRSSKSGSA